MIIKPHALKIGDQVALVSLSSGVMGEEFAEHEVRKGEQRLKEFGLQPVFMKNSRKGIKYLSDHPEARAEDLKQAFMSPNIKGIICAIGGDDTYRLMPYLMEDNEFITAVKENPKLFSGFSDTTIDHLFLNRLGLVTYYGPNLLNDLGELDQEMLPYTHQAFLEYFEDRTSIEVKSSPVWYEERTDFSVSALNTPRIQHDEKHGYLALRGSGQVKGKLFGGCIDSIGDALLGDRYDDMPAVISKYDVFPAGSFWKDRILFIETSEEKISPSNYQKILEALDQRGVLENVSAMIVGKPQNEVNFEEYQQVLLKVTEKYQTPILYNLNFGHAYPRTVIPYNLQAQIDFDQRRFSIEEPFFS